jgi:hypothetical protein
VEKEIQVSAVELSQIPAFDLVNVYWEEFGHGRGRVTITCYGEAWNAYWYRVEVKVDSWGYLRPIEADA